jgi:hypothetical protein
LEVGYTSATTGRGDHEVHKGDMWWHWEKKTNGDLRRHFLSNGRTVIWIIIASVQQYSDARIPEDDLKKPSIEIWREKHIFSFGIS